MSAPARKRLRLDNALHKPFRSPLKSNANDHNPVDTFEKKSTSSNHTSNLHPRASHGSEASNTAQHTPRNLVKPSSSVDLVSTSAGATTTDRELEARIRAVRSELDILAQADRLLQSNRHDELTSLINTWKSTARAAAEELFAGVKDKVNQMGGVAAWRENEEKRDRRRRDWDREAREDEMKKEEEDLEDVEEQEPEEGETAEEAEARALRKDRAWEAKQARREMLEQMKSDASKLEIEAAAAEVETTKGHGGNGVVNDDVSPKRR